MKSTRSLLIALMCVIVAVATVSGPLMRTLNTPVPETLVFNKPETGWESVAWQPKLLQVDLTDYSERNLYDTLVGPEYYVGGSFSMTPDDGRRYFESTTYKMCVDKLTHGSDDILVGTKLRSVTATETYWEFRAATFIKSFHKVPNSSGGINWIQIDNAGLPVATCSSNPEGREYCIYEHTAMANTPPFEKCEDVFLRYMK